jgi:predicted amidohydrolase
MRNVKVAAIQPGHIGLPPQYSPYSADYLNDPNAIINDYVAKQLETTEMLLEQAGLEGCDVVTTCEDATVLADFGLDITGRNIFPELVARSAPLADRIYSDISRKYSMYVIGCRLKAHEGKIYNTAAIFDRGGAIAGEYKKTHLPANETWQCDHGDSLDVFELDFGKIGICICYDIMFPETVRTLALKGAEIIFHPTFGYGWYDSIGEATLRTRANDSGVYIVTAKNYVYNGAGMSSVIDDWGHVVAGAGFSENVVVTHTIDLDSKKTHPDWYINTGISGAGQLTQRMFGERRPELYTAICEPKTPLPSHSHEDKLRILGDLRAGKIHW